MRAVLGVVDIALHHACDAPVDGIAGGIELSPGCPSCRVLKGLLIRIGLGLIDEDFLGDGVGIGNDSQLVASLVEQQLAGEGVVEGLARGNGCDGVGLHGLSVDEEAYGHVLRCTAADVGQRGSDGNAVAADVGRELRRHEDYGIDIRGQGREEAQSVDEQLRGVVACQEEYGAAVLWPAAC